MTKKWETIKIDGECKIIHLPCGQIMKNGYEVADHCYTCKEDKEHPPFDNAFKTE